jgi:indolepyruvate ferredoxin oxidoreductase alpha subunit
MVLEEGMPVYIENDIRVALHRAGANTALHGRDWTDAQGEDKVELLARGLLALLDRHAPGTVAQPPVVLRRQADPMNSIH